jgi:hypothetical protein
LNELQINATVRGETLLRNVTDVSNAPRTKACVGSPSVALALDRLREQQGDAIGSILAAQMPDSTDGAS